MSSSSYRCPECVILHLREPYVPKRHPLWQTCLPIPWKRDDGDLNRPMLFWWCWEECSNWILVSSPPFKKWSPSGLFNTRSVEEAWSTFAEIVLSGNKSPLGIGYGKFRWLLSCYILHNVHIIKNYTYIRIFTHILFIITWFHLKYKVSHWKWLK